MCIKYYRLVYKNYDSNNYKLTKMFAVYISWIKLLYTLLNKTVSVLIMI